MEITDEGSQDLPGMTAGKKRPSPHKK